MNILKTNNRFSSLLEDNKPSHNFDTRQPKNGSRSNYNKYNHDSKKVQVHANINMNDFPALIDSQTNGNACNVTHNYAEKVLIQQAIVEPTKGELLPYGWILLAPNTNNATNKYTSSYKIPNCLAHSMETALVKLYNKRKEAYIDLWGDEEYEKMFSFPNHEPEHEYLYFDEDTEDDDEEDDSSVDEYYEYDDEYYYN